MIRASNMTLARGARILMERANFDIPPGARVGFVGRNGTGKSSLFAALSGELATDAGDLIVPPTWVRASVAQHMPQSQDSALNYALAGDELLRTLRIRWEHAQEHGDGMELAHLASDLDHAGHWDADARCAQLLRGLGFADSDLSRSVDEFSGGWRMRLALARTLMSRSDLLLLDEPTNHLDLDTVLWLEAWLKRYSGTLLVISHDRDFLDSICTHTLYLDGTTAQLYTGGFSAFARQRAAHVEQAKREAAQVDAQRAHLQKFIDRFKAKASKARQAQSRVKALEKLSAAPIPSVESEVHWTMPAPAKLPDPILSLDAAAAGYGARRVISDVNLFLAPGDRLGLLGRNGAGKSTLMKLLAGVLEAQAGERRAPRDLSIGYFAQSQVEELPSEVTPLVLLREKEPSFSDQAARNYLGGFGYGGDLATTAIGPRSGGEKARLALALLLARRPNLLLLDEPTNHLDMAARAALVEALADFAGAVVMVSHDRSLLESVCDRFVRVYQGGVGEYTGDLDDYAKLLRGEGSVAAVAPAEPQAKPVEHKDRRGLSNQLKRAEEALDRASATESAAQSALDRAASHGGSHAELAHLADALKAASAAREKAEAEWLVVAERAEKA